MILEEPGTVDVSHNFDTVMFFGFFVNASIIFYFLVKRICFDPRNSPKMILVFLYTASLVMFVWMMFARFSHPGRVCSGDFDDFLEQALEEKFVEGQFDQYYLREEGKFFFVYTILMLVLTLNCFVIIPFAMFVFYKLSNKSIDRPIVWAAYNSVELLSWSKKEGRKLWEDVKEKAEENKDEFMATAQNMFAEAMKEGNWEEYIMQLSE